MKSAWAIDSLKETLGHPIHGSSLQVYVHSTATHAGSANSQKALSTVIRAMELLVQHRQEYPRVDEALKRNLLEKIVIEDRVLNRDGKEFPFLVARTSHKGRVKLLINAVQLVQDGHLNHPDILMLRLAKEFQWVISKAYTSAKPRPPGTERDLEQARIHTNDQIKRMRPEDRKDALLGLFETYLTTIDEFSSLSSQPFYEQGRTNLQEPDQPFSTIHWYDIKIREALELIVTQDYFMKMTPKAVRNLLNGKIWNVAYVKIDSRDWTTRTRVLPKDQAVEVGQERTRIQPAKVLINYHRTVDTQDQLFSLTEGLPMGALSSEQLARVIAWEIQNQITEKSLRGHVAEDEQSASQESTP